MKEKRNNFADILKQIEQIEKELREIRKDITQCLTPEIDISNRKEKMVLEFTMDDLYEAFGQKNKSYAVRLRNALEKKGITTLGQFLAMTPGQILNLEGIGFGTMKYTSKAMEKLGIQW